LDFKGKRDFKESQVFKVYKALQEIVGLKEFKEIKGMLVQLDRLVR
jgi:hypothetical protein